MCSCHGDHDDSNSNCYVNTELKLQRWVYDVIEQMAGLKKCTVDVHYGMPREEKTLLPTRYPKLFGSKAIMRLSVCGVDFGDCGPEQWDYSDQSIRQGPVIQWERKNGVLKEKVNDMGMVL